MAHILVLSPDSGAIDRRIAAQVGALIDSGHSVTLVSKAPVEDPVVQLAGVQAISCQPTAEPERRIPDAVRRLLRPIKYRFLGGSDRAFLTHFVPLVQREVASFDAVHCHDLPTLRAGMVLSRERDTPLIYDSHELFPKQFPDRAFESYWADVEQELIVHASAVITVNESIADDFVANYNIERPLVIYNSFDAETTTDKISREEFWDYFGAPPGDNDFIFQGQIVGDRNLEDTIRAFAGLQSGRLFVLGDGPMKKKLERQCRLGRVQNVFFGDRVGRSSLLRMLRGAQYGIIPYRGDYSRNHFLCTPNKLFEFLASGLPICASDLPELRRIIEATHAGSVYPMRGVHEISAAIRDFLDRAGEFREETSRRGTDTYSWPEQASRLLGLYRDLGL